MMAGSFFEFSRQVAILIKQTVKGNGKDYGERKHAEECTHHIVQGKQQQEKQQQYDGSPDYIAQVCSVGCIHVLSFFC